MNDALLAVIVLTCCWIALVAFVKLFNSWLSKVLPKYLQISATWYSISIHSSSVPSFLRQTDSFDVMVDMMDPGVDRSSSRDLLIDVPKEGSDDDDTDDDDDGVVDELSYSQVNVPTEPQKEVTEPQKQPVLPTPAAKKPKSGWKKIRSRFRRMYGTNSHGWHKFYSIGAMVSCFLAVIVILFSLINPVLTIIHVIKSARDSAIAAVKGVKDLPPDTVLKPTATVNIPTFDGGIGTGLEFIIPGVTVSFNKFIAMLVAIVICGIFHELGHAYAATVQGYAVQGVGLEVYFLLVPKFYADIDGAVQHAPPAQSLRVFCGGVWHNIVMGTLSILFIVEFSGLAHLVLYGTPTTTPIVSDIPSYSPMKASRIKVGDTIVSVGDCLVNDTESWARCLDILADQQSPSSQKGFCLPRTTNGTLVDEHTPAFSEDDIYLRMKPWVEKRGNPTIEQCCKKGYNKRGQCFFITKWSLGMSESFQKKWCLEPHAVVANAVGRCSEVGKECNAENTSGICVIPVLPEEDDDVDDEELEEWWW